MTSGSELISLGLVSGNEGKIPPATITHISGFSLLPSRLVGGDLPSITCRLLRPVRLSDGDFWASAVALLQNYVALL